MARFNDIDTIQELRSIVQSTAFRAVLAERREYFQKEVNRFVGDQDWMNAYASLKRFEDTNKLIEILEQKIAQAKGEK
jgi:hypothetical protein